MKIDSKNLHEMSNALRADALRAIAAAKSGHVGIVLGAADIVTMIYAVFLNPARDRFVLSAGHGSAMLYAVLKLAGYNIGDLKSFRQIGGPPGHPEFGIDGVSATTGPLGQGVANAVGMAIAAKHNKTGGRVYCLCSDGDLMEGVAQEAIGFAGRYGLDNLVLLWDNNGLSIDGVAQVDKNVSMRMRAAGWTVRAADGTDMNELYDAISAPAVGPLFVRCDTTLGQGASVSGTARAHGFAIDEAEITNLIKHLDSATGRDLWRKFARGHKKSESIKYANVPRVSVPQKKVAMSTRDVRGILGGGYADGRRYYHRQCGFGTKYECACAGRARNYYGQFFRAIYKLWRARTCDGGNYERYGICGCARGGFNVFSIQ